MKLLLTILTAPIRLVLGLLIWVLFAIWATWLIAWYALNNDYGAIKDLKYSEVFTYCLPRVFFWTVGKGKLFS